MNHEASLVSIIGHLHNSLDNVSINALGACSHSLYIAWSDRSFTIRANNYGVLLREHEVDIVHMKIPSMSYIEGASLDLLFAICANKLERGKASHAFICLPHTMEEEVDDYLDNFEYDGDYDISMYPDKGEKLEQNCVYVIFDMWNRGLDLLQKKGKVCANYFYCSMISWTGKMQRIASVYDSSVSICPTIIHNIIQCKEYDLYRVCTNIIENVKTSYVALLKYEEHIDYLDETYYYEDEIIGVPPDTSLSDLIIIFNGDISDKVLSVIYYIMRAMRLGYNDNAEVTVHYVCLTAETRLLANMLKKNLHVTYEQYDQSCIALRRAIDDGVFNAQL